MATILDTDGYMVTWEYVDIVERVTDDINGLTAEIAAGNTFDCL